MEVAADGSKGKAEAGMDSGTPVVAELSKCLDEDCGDAGCEQEEINGDIEPAALAELMKWLEESGEGEGCGGGGGGFSFLDTNCSSSSLCFPTAASVTINGNEESCGSSFSGNASTVMASVDTRGGFAGALPYFVGCPSDLAAAWPCSASPYRTWKVGSAAGTVGGADEGKVEVGGGGAETWRAISVDDVAIGV